MEEKSSVDEMGHWEASRFVEYIDRRFFDAKKRGISRLSVEWGEWSREMNLVLRKRVKLTQVQKEIRLRHVTISTIYNIAEEEAAKLTYVFNYWVIISQILEYHFKGRIINHGKIKKRRKEAVKIKNMIRTGKNLKENKSDITDLVFEMLKRK